MDFNAIFFSNGDVCEEFTMDRHYIGPACNCPAPSFHFVVECYNVGYMVRVCARDDEHPQTNLVGKNMIVVPQLCSN